MLLPIMTSLKNFIWYTHRLCCSHESDIGQGTAQTTSDASESRKDMGKKGITVILLKNHPERHCY